jgi:hypothetical protein
VAQSAAPLSPAGLDARLAIAYPRSPRLAGPVGVGARQGRGWGATATASAAWRVSSSTARPIRTITRIGNPDRLPRRRNRDCSTTNRVVSRLT